MMHTGNEKNIIYQFILDEWYTDDDVSVEW